MIHVTVSREGGAWTARNREPFDGRMFAETAECRERALQALYSKLQAHGARSLVRVVGEPWSAIRGL